MKFTVVIPAYNAGSCIANTIKKIDEFSITFPHTIDLVIVNDGSTDNTENAIYEGLRLYENMKKHYYFPLNKNHGKWYCLKYGVQSYLDKKLATDFFVFMDADSAVPITELPRFAARTNIPTLVPGVPQVVLGKRGKNTTYSNQLRRIASRFAHFLMGLLFPEARGFDTQCPFKLIWCGAAVKIFTEKFSEDRFLGDLLLVIRANKLKLSMLSMPVHYDNAETTSTVRLSTYFRSAADVFRIFFNKIRGKYGG